MKTTKSEKINQRKKILKIVLPIVILLVIVIAIFNKNGLKGFMGNSLDYNKCTCEEGWHEGDNETCYQENVSQSHTMAYLLGDANDNGEVNGEDLDIINDFLTTKLSGTPDTLIELDERQEVVYDINKDGEINDLDSEKMNEIFEVTAEGSKVVNNNYQEEYLCPKDKTEETTDEYGILATTTTEYKQDETNKQICYVTTTVKVSKKAVCEKDDMSNTSSSSIQTNIDEPSESEEEARYQLNIQTNICTREECNNDIEIRTKSKDTNMLIEGTQSSSVVVEENEEDNDED